MKKISDFQFERRQKEAINWLMIYAVSISFLMLTLFNTIDLGFKLAEISETRIPMFLHHFFVFYFLVIPFGCIFFAFIFFYLGKEVIGKKNRLKYLNIGNTFMIISIAFFAFWILGLIIQLGMMWGEWRNLEIIQSYK